MATGKFNMKRVILQILINAVQAITSYFIFGVVSKNQTKKIAAISKLVWRLLLACHRNDK
jgi:hypothetical protein